MSSDQGREEVRRYQFAHRPNRHTDCARVVDANESIKQHSAASFVPELKYHFKSSGRSTVAHDFPIFKAIW